MKGQHTYESCLAWCLLYLAGEEPLVDKEIEIVNFSLWYTKKDFTIGHLEAVKNKFKKIRLHIDTDFRFECNSTFQLRKSKNISICACNVLNVVQFILDESKIKRPIIVYLDAFALWQYRHYPHFIIILKKESSQYTILDPWDGKIRKVHENVILEGMLLLKNYLGFAPRAIIVHRD